MQNAIYNDIVPAHRVQQIKEYYFSVKLKEIASLNAQGAGIISLGVGGPDRPPHPTPPLSTPCVARLTSPRHMGINLMWEFRL